MVEICRYLETVFWSYVLDTESIFVGVMREI